MKKKAFVAICSNLMLGTCSGCTKRPPAKHYEARWLEIMAKEKELGPVEFIRKIDLLDAEMPEDYKGLGWHQTMMFYRLTALA